MAAPPSAFVLAACLVFSDLLEIQVAFLFRSLWYVSLRTKKNNLELVAAENVQIAYLALPLLFRTVDGKISIRKPFRTNCYTTISIIVLYFFNIDLTMITICIVFGTICIYIYFIMLMFNTIYYIYIIWVLRGTANGFCVGRKGKRGFSSRRAFTKCPSRHRQDGRYFAQYLVWSFAVPSKTWNLKTL